MKRYLVMAVVVQMLALLCATTVGLAQKPLRGEVAVGMVNCWYSGWLPGTPDTIKIASGVTDSTDWTYIDTANLPRNAWALVVRAKGVGATATPTTLLTEWRYQYITDDADKGPFHLDSTTYTYDGTTKLSQYVFIPLTIPNPKPKRIGVHAYGTGTSTRWAVWNYELIAS